MAIETPTTQEISDNLVAQVESSLNQSVPSLPRSFVRVFSKAAAGVFILLYKYMGWIFLQMFVRTASFDATTINGKTVRPLVEWGILVGAGEPEAATRAELEIEITVTDQGDSLRQGAQLVNQDTGVTYITLSSTSLDASTVTATIRAVSDQNGGGGRGVIGNMEAGETLAFASKPAGVEREVTVLSQEVTGADGESETNYRQRVIDRFRQRPQGGAYSDYQEWAVEPPGIVAAYPYTGDPGIVEVYVEATEESSGSADGIPTQAQLGEVEDAIDFDQRGLPSRRPANAFVDVRAISRTEFDVEVQGLDTDSESSVKAAIESAADEYLRGREPFILGLSVLPRRDVVSAAQLSGIIWDVVSQEGGTFDAVVLSEGGTEVLSRSLGNGEKAKVGTVTYA